MRVYETTFIINPQVDDATIDQQVSAVSDIITKAGGKILHEQRVGTRRMAYAIKGIAQGYYTSLYHEAPTEALTSLNRHFRLGELYLRDLTIRFEGDIEAVAEQQSISESFTRRRPEGDHDRDRPSRPERRPDRDSRPGRDSRPQRAPETSPKVAEPAKAEAKAPAPAPATSAPAPAAAPEPTSQPKPKPAVVQKPEAPKSTAPAPDSAPKPPQTPAPESYNEEDEL